MGCVFGKLGKNDLKEEPTLPTNYPYPRIPSLPVDDRPAGDGWPSSPQNLPLHGDIQRQLPINDYTQILQEPPAKDSQPGETPNIIVGQCVVALHDFVGRNSIEASFKQGDRFMVIREQSEDFLYGRHLNSRIEGFIPRAYVCQEWFFENTTRSDAENSLMKGRNDEGAFLVRSTTNMSPFHKYSISVKIMNASGASVRHYRVLQRDGKIYCTKEVTFENFSKLIEYYEMSRGEENVMRLRVPCERIFQRYDVDVNWELDRNDIKWIQRVGAGNFGEVHLAEMRGGTLQVAIKTLKENSMTVEDFMKEATIMKTMRHKYILPLWGVCSQEEPLLIVTEYMNLGSLLAVLRANTHLNCLKKKINVSYQVASGMAYMENHRYIHRDLAARNVLVNSDLDCKICDFGMAKICEEEYSPQNLKQFPVKWSAPEVVDYHTYTIKSDVWSFGVVLMEIFTNGIIPYPGMNNQEVIAKVRTGYRMKKPQECPPDLFEAMVEKSWKYSAEDRPTFQSMASYFDAYDLTVTTQYHQVD